MSAGAISHFEIAGKDSKGLRDFYGKIFNWTMKVESMPEGEYTMVKTSGNLGGGICGPMGPMDNYVLMYVDVDDINASVKQIEGAGGKLIAPRTEIPGVVTFAIFQDPAGNYMGLTECGSHS